MAQFDPFDHMDASAALPCMTSGSNGSDVVRKEPDSAPIKRRQLLGPLGLSGPPRMV